MQHRGRRFRRTAHSRPRKALSVWRLMVSDGSGYMNITWFNQDYAVRNIHPGDRFLFFGTVKRLGARIEMTNPVFERLGEGVEKSGQVLPVYGLTEGVSQNQLRAHVREALKGVAASAGEILPDEMRIRHGFDGMVRSCRNHPFSGEDRGSEGGPGSSGL